MKKIETKERVKLFSNFIKDELKNFTSNVEDNLDSNLAFEILNTDYIIICDIFEKEGMATLELERLNRLDSEGAMPFVIDNFMFGNGFNLNKHTTDEELDKIANRIINEYNLLVDKETE